MALAESTATAESLPTEFPSFTPFGSVEALLDFATTFAAPFLLVAVKLLICSGCTAYRNIDCKIMAESEMQSQIISSHLTG